MKSILVIDDDLLFSRVLGQFLERCGYRVRVANSGGEGIDQYRKEVADLVITDLRMPAKDGLDTIADLQRLPAMFAARGYSEDDIAAILHGQNAAGTDLIADGILQSTPQVALLDLGCMRSVIM